MVDRHFPFTTQGKEGDFLNFLLTLAYQDSFKLTSLDERGGFRIALMLMLTKFPLMDMQLCLQTVKYVKARSV